MVAPALLWDVGTCFNAPALKGTPSNLRGEK